MTDFETYNDDLSIIITLDAKEQQQAARLAKLYIQETTEYDPDIHGEPSQNMLITLGIHMAITHADEHFFPSRYPEDVFYSDANLKDFELSMRFTQDGLGDEDDQ